MRRVQPSGATLGPVRRVSLLLVSLGAVLFGAPPAFAEWLPHPADAKWNYQWSDTAYQTTPTSENVTVKTSKGKSFTLAWTTEDEDLKNADDAAASVGTVSFQETNSGVVNTDWSSNAPPPSFPVLCASSSQCGNSLAST